MNGAKKTGSSKRGNGARPGVEVFHGKMLRVSEAIGAENLITVVEEAEAAGLRQMAGQHIFYDPVRNTYTVVYVDTSTPAYKEAERREQAHVRAMLESHRPPQPRPVQAPARRREDADNAYT